MLRSRAPLSRRGGKDLLCKEYAALLAGLLGLTLFFAVSVEAADLTLGARNLSFGSWGGDVFRLQQELVQTGYELTVDGHFGTGTERVVMAFQLANGLTPDGIVGLETIAALKAVRPMFIYVVQPGDSLWEIARRFETTMEELITVNNLPDRPLPIGKQLEVPAQPTYKVGSGDTLWEIAQRFRTTVEALADLNEIEDPSRIRVNRDLKLPRGSEPTLPGF